MIEAVVRFENDTPSTFGAALRRVRQERHLRLRDVAEMTTPQMSESSLSNIERGEQQPSVFVVLAIAKALDVSLAELAGEINENTERAQITSSVMRLVPDERLAAFDEHFRLWVGLETTFQDMLTGIGNQVQTHIMGQEPPPKLRKVRRVKSA